MTVGRFRWPIVELVLTLSVLLGLVGTIDFFLTRGYLPQPFVFDVYDTFMDWFNTAYYAHNRGAFDIWRTVYPPISFVFLKIFGLSACYQYSPVYARDCDWLGKATILTAYVIDVVLVYFAFRRIDPHRGLLRAVAFGAGLPLLYTLERGNLILPCFAFFVIAYAPLTQSRWLRYLSIAVTINFKPYLLLPILPLAIKREWRMLELAGFATIGVYLVTLTVFGSGTPLELFSNIVDWAQFTSVAVWEQVYYSTSYAPLLNFDVYQFPVRDFLGSRTVDAMVFTIPLLIRSAQAVTCLCIVGAWLQPKALALQRLSLLVLGCSLIGQSPGGYTEVFVVFLVFLEPWTRPGVIVATIAAYLLCIPYDWTISNFFQIGDLQNWLSGRPVEANFGLALGTLLRPGLMLVILWGIALDSLWLVFLAHRHSRPSLGLAAPTMSDPVFA